MKRSDYLRVLLLLASVAWGSAGNIAAAQSQYETTVLTDHPEVYYWLGESPGTALAVDTSGNGHAGSYAGGVTLGLPGALAGDSDTSIAFDGTTGIVNSGIDLLSPNS